MKNYFVYILKCSDDSYYTGVINNLEKRLAEHNTGNLISSYTFKGRPVALMFSQQFHDILQAIALEKQIKKWSRRKKEAFINEEWERLKMLTDFGKTPDISKPSSTSSD